MVKYLAEKFQAAVSPLTDIIHNQEIIIGQNKQIINLLTRSVAIHNNELESEETKEDEPAE